MISIKMRYELESRTKLVQQVVKNLKRPKITIKVSKIDKEPFFKQWIFLLISLI